MKTFILFLIYRYRSRRDGLSYGRAGTDGSSGDWGKQQSEANSRLREVAPR